MSSNSQTFRLFKKIPGFVDGISSTMSFFSDDTEIYRADETEAVADSNSIYADWLAVGNDMRTAIDDVKTEIKKHG